MTEVAGSSSMSQAASTGQCLDATDVKRSTSGKRKRCEHGELRWHCRFCSGCPHGKAKQNCKQCSPCPHGKILRAVPRLPTRENEAELPSVQRVSTRQAEAELLSVQRVPPWEGQIPLREVQCRPHGKRKRSCMPCSALPSTPCQKRYKTLSQIWRCIFSKASSTQHQSETPVKVFVEPCIKSHFQHELQWGWRRAGLHNGSEAACT
ncbi:unnamed protein product [Effrenium voratum]|uniref:Uncharacterized protein n=1 Tax=Effrenium voratum TaxID=2562239 RepID=A0AA36J3X7_9DINO|nr:unnamed protein product [Effrenium voratum]